MVYQYQWLCSIPVVLRHGMPVTPVYSGNAAAAVAWRRCQCHQLQCRRHQWCQRRRFERLAALAAGRQAAQDREEEAVNPGGRRVLYGALAPDCMICDACCVAACKNIAASFL
jgi:hypothetical protein